MILFFDGDDSPEIHCCFVDLSSRRMVGEKIALADWHWYNTQRGMFLPDLLFVLWSSFRDRFCFSLFHDVLAILLLFLGHYVYILIYSQFSSLRALAPLLHVAARLTKFTPFMKH
jgi:hypothetical protein